MFRSGCVLVVLTRRVWDDSEDSSSIGVAHFNACDDTYACVLYASVPVGTWWNNMKYSNNSGTWLLLHNCNTKQEFSEFIRAGIGYQTKCQYIPGQDNTSKCQSILDQNNTSKCWNAEISPARIIPQNAKVPSTRIIPWKWLGCCNQGNPIDQKMIGVHVWYQNTTIRPIKRYCRFQWLYEIFSGRSVGK